MCIRRRSYGCSGSHADHCAYRGCAGSRTAVITCRIVWCGRMVPVVRGWRMISVVGVRRMVRRCPVVVGVSCAVPSLAGGGAAVCVGVSSSTVIVVGGAATILICVRRSLAVRVRRAGAVGAVVAGGTVAVRRATAVAVRMRIRQPALEREQRNCQTQAGDNDLVLHLLTPCYCALAGLALTGALALGSGSG